MGFKERALGVLESAITLPYGKVYGSLLLAFGFVDLASKLKGEDVLLPGWAPTAFVWMAAVTAPITVWHLLRPLDGGRTLLDRWRIRRLVDRVTDHVGVANLLRNHFLRANGFREDGLRCRKEQRSHVDIDQMRTNLRKWLRDIHHGASLYLAKPTDRLPIENVRDVDRRIPPKYDENTSGQLIRFDAFVNLVDRQLHDALDDIQALIGGL